MPIRKSEHMSLGEALQSFIKENGLQKGMDQIDVKEAWKQLMGNTVHNYVKDLTFRNETLYVTLTSSVLREELSYGKEKIIKMVNEELGRDLIRKIVFL
ncbi:DUF721 domain-containing protein [Ascidiimonas aurantiaca]|uniref:DUF721 domain-containing protein n=1 Tax=Ascidiimonas aurantiaca TaxID=1685432 RepID=UPI0030ECD90E